MTRPLDDNGLAVDAPGTISVFSGYYVDPLAMTEDDVDIVDVAHALSRLCRYNGHCRGFLSVARHSIWVADLLAEHDPVIQLTGLLHDASEAYLGDMVRPLKYSKAMKPFRDAEERLERVIASKFDLPYPLPPEIHEADRLVLVERELPTERYRWTSTPDVDERDFLTRFYYLTGKRS